MTQLLVTLDDTQPLSGITNAIRMLRGVMSADVVGHIARTKTLKQQKYVKDSLERAASELKTKSKAGVRLKTLDEFINEI